MTRLPGPQVTTREPRMCEVYDGEYPDRCPQPLYSRTRCKKHFMEELEALYASIKRNRDHYNRELDTLSFRGHRKVMGDYISLRMRGRLNEEGVRAWDALGEHMSRGRDSRDVWYAASIAVIDRNLGAQLRAFSDIPRSSFVPFGAISYAPDGWEVGFENKQDGDKVQFACSVKIVGIVEYFLKNVAPLLFKEVDICESYDELEHETTIWAFDGEKFTGIIETAKGE